MRCLWRLLVLGLFLAGTAICQPRRVLYITHSAGYRHDTIPTSIEALVDAAKASGALEIVATEDVSM